MMANGRTPVTCKASGVDLPTHAASTQWVFGSSRVVRLYLVRPPEPHSTGNPSTSNRLNNCQRVAFTAAASLNGAFAWARIFLRRSGFFFKKTAMSFVPFARLHFSHAKHRLLIRRSATTGLFMATFKRIVNGC